MRALAPLISNIIPASRLRVYNDNIRTYNNNNFVFAVLSPVVYTTLVAPLTTYPIASAVASGAISLYIYNTNTIRIDKPREVYYSNSVILFSNNYTI